ncbi:MAG: tRNA lysidine(34) synthetase TilS [Propionibacteriaceae bacterium]|nr:tRNA lysidine(34) synthetase TilS [Propionibacteriaceae bacterium]
MAKRALGPAALRVAQAVQAAWPGECIVGCSGGADSLALALGAQWVAEQRGGSVTAVVVDHGLQEGSPEIAARVADLLRERGLHVEIARVTVDATDGGVEAAAREARLGALAAFELPVLLGHTLDDQAETVLLGLLRGSGTRSLAGMADQRDQFLRPLLGLRRADTVAACQEWGVTPWSDPMNDELRYARVAIRHHLAALGEAVGRDLAPALARTAQLARADADLLDDLAAQAVQIDGDLAVADLAQLPDALRWRVLHRWLGRLAPSAEFQHVHAVDKLITAWRGQGPIAVPGGQVLRRDGALSVR